MDANYQGTRGGAWLQVLRWLNLRPEEGERTWLMFAFYTATTVGLSWLDNSTAGLFVDRYGAAGLPLIYLCNAVIGALIGVAYSLMQKVIPLRQTIVLVPILIALPLVAFRAGLGIEHLAALTVFVMRLWLDVTNGLNDINTAITANQIFNIREIKRTYPLISSGVLVADVISGFSLPFLLAWVGLPNVLLLSALTIAMGGGILFYLGRAYSQAFPDAPSRFIEESQADSNRRLQGPLRSYANWLVAFFMLAQVLFLLVEFQFFDRLELQSKTAAAAGTGSDVASSIASFLGLFNGVLGLAELLTQWLVSSRAIERIGLFRSAAVLPCAVLLTSSLALLGIPLSSYGFSGAFLGAIGLKFADELLRYTLFASTSPVLFQPIPDSVRGTIQARVRGVFESLSTGVMGLLILGMVYLCKHWLPETWVDAQSWIVLGTIVALAGFWLVAVWGLRSRYISLLVVSAERGRLGTMDVDSSTLRQAVVEALVQPGTTPEDKRSCIELLSRIDPDRASEVLAPLLTGFAPALQKQSLEVMLDRPQTDYLAQVRALIVQQPPPEVLAAALRYVWITESDQDVRHLQPYLRPEVDPMVRGTAASLIMRRGSASQKAEATTSLRRMLTSSDVRERVMGCRALGEAAYLQALRLYVPDLLQDPSVEVRCALLEVIASARLEDYYPALLRGLNYKSTRESALRGLTKLEHEVLPMLLETAEDCHRPDLMRMQAWGAIGRISTSEALDILVSRLLVSWGATRQTIMRTLLKLPDDSGIEGVLRRMGRSGVETAIDQELRYIGQLAAALVDLSDPGLEGREADLLRQSLHDSIQDSHDRLFSLMKFLYPIGSIQAASFNLRSGSRESVARGLEILDNTLDIPSKRAVLGIFDSVNDRDRLMAVNGLVSYQPMAPRDRVRRLLDLRHFLSDWPLACCFHLARSLRWSLTTDQALACLRHPRGFVREAVLAYLELASERMLTEILPRMVHDPDRLVLAQVKQLSQSLGLTPADKPVDSSGRA